MNDSFESESVQRAEPRVAEESRKCPDVGMKRRRQWVASKLSTLSTTGIPNRQSSARHKIPIFLAIGPYPF